MPLIAYAGRNSLFVCCRHFLQQFEKFVDSGFFFCVLVVDSILRGVEVGIGPRRTRQTNKEQQAITVSLYLSIEKTVLW